MNINFTLVIQAINFFISYWLLRVFVFKPIVQTIEQERTYQKNLLAQIQTNTQLAQQLAQIKQEKWQEYQQEFGKKTPDVVSQDLYVLHHLTSVIETPGISNQEQTALVKEVAQAIIKKVEHVH